MSGPLSAEQLEFFQREGYIVAAELIDAEIVGRAEATLWELLGTDPDKPESWPRNSNFKDRLSYMTDEAIYDLYTPRFSAAMEQLTGKPLGRPEEGDVIQAIVAFPTHEPWRVHLPPHVDNAVEGWGLKCFPRSQRGNTLIYLSDTEPQGGGTAVWPGWPAKLVERIQADPERYELLIDVQREIASGEIDLGEPLELTPRAGDVLVIDPFMPHTATVNVDKCPRFMITRQVEGDQPQSAEMVERGKEFEETVALHVAEERRQGRRRALTAVPSLLE
jgi:hypothetical protein